LTAARILCSVVVLVTACGSGSVGEDGFDGVLDCETGWTHTFEYGDDAQGAQVPFGAMQEWASGYERLDYTLHVETSREATVVVDGQEVALISTVELASETFAVIEVSGCAGFER